MHLIWQNQLLAPEVHALTYSSKLVLWNNLDLLPITLSSTHHQQMHALTGFRFQAFQELLYSFPFVVLFGQMKNLGMFL
jgi:hypothetical protein